MKVDEKGLEAAVEAAWNAISDGPNQWCCLSLDERETYVSLITAYEAAKTAEGAVAWKEGDVAYAKVRIDTPPDEDGWAFVTPAAHPDDVARLGHPEWEDSDQFFGCVIAPPQVTHE